MRIAFSKSLCKSCSVYSTSHASPKDRTAEVSLPLQPTDTIDIEKTTIQPQSLLLAKLPSEIRRRIYELAFGTKTIHFIRHDVSSEIRCPCPDRMCNSPEQCGNGDNSQCYACTVYSPSGSIRWERLPPWKKSNLLVACRQIYAEAATLLASIITASIIAHDRDDLLILTELRGILPFTQYHAIRSIEFCYHIANHRTTFDDFQHPLWFTRWVDICASLQSMRGLQDLHLWINNEYSYNRRIDMTSEQEQQILQPLRELARLINVKAEISWPTTSSAGDVLEETSLNVTRRVGFVCPCAILEAKPYISRSSHGQTTEDNSSRMPAENERLSKSGIRGNAKQRNSIWRRMACC
ncbi:hypothetical protein BDV33DRAFT_172593 [Aspergillus novoparasiticus]|uniref:DUF7730 domain-containing protein n=1 Tax=Aspergillus novoparasiticus TaxID=986946 RepID=A0A5N6ERQ3_9EURO|nr:hypothetical protein BDV33DRAFT_172593 [Aspergillus novoparasiticus]